MDKPTIATQVLLKLIETDKTGFDAEGIAGYAWEIADAMQAEADKRKPCGLPEALKEEWQPDWSQAPEWAVAWTMDSSETLWWSYKPVFNNGHWLIEDSVLWKRAEAPSFGFTGNHIVERPNGF